MSIVARLPATLVRLGRDRRGVAAYIFAASFLVFAGASGYVIDLGNAYVAQRTLQASADAAALAGAAEINCCAASPGQALVTARQFSGVAGGHNRRANVDATMVAGFPQLRCLASTSTPCAGPDNANAVIVRQQAVVPTIFSKLFGVNSITVAATSTASASGGQPIPLDVMIVLDATGSMNTADPSCSIPGATRLMCAKAGALTLLRSLSGTVNHVGLMTFPGTTNAAQAARNYACGGPRPTVARYNASPVYQILGLSGDYTATASSGASSTADPLNTTSNLVRAMGGGGAGCAQGMQAVGGVGTFFADAINEAQATLASTGRRDVQKVIIILSDGDAGASAGNMVPAKYRNQCQQAITAAASARAAGTWVYAIAYGAPTSATGSCPVDLPRISACSTMQQIASEPAKFFSDQIGGASACTSAANAESELVSVFSRIATSFGGGSRLISDNTT